MSGSQKTLRVFGILELLLAIGGAVFAITSGEPISWLSVVASLLAAYLLLAAAKDARKAGGAWAITLLELILSILSTILSLSGGDADGAVIAGSAVAILVNLIAFIAANNVKKQAKNM